MKKLKIRKLGVCLTYSGETLQVHVSENCRMFLTVTFHDGFKFTDSHLGITAAFGDVLHFDEHGIDLVRSGVALPVFRRVKQKECSQDQREPCPDCKGTEKYVGLVEVRPCPTCCGKLDE